MTIWTGIMDTALLNDRQIRPSEYRKWKHAQRRFATREEDRKTVDNYRNELAQRGRFKEPIILGIDDRHHDVYVRDGHHRAVALIELGVPTFEYHWYWIRSFGVHMEHEPFPRDMVNL